MTDLLLVNPGATRKRVYQDLSKVLSAIEPPFWCALTAGFMRLYGFDVDILDANVLNISIDETAKKVCQSNPCLVNIIVYGQHPAASTALMDSVILLCKAIKEIDDGQKVIVTGLHPSALPVQTMFETGCDYVGVGEGFYTLLDLMKPAVTDLNNVRGLVYRKGSYKRVGFFNGRTDNIQNLTKELPDVAWDLLPMDKYRAHNWQCIGDFSTRDSYASLSTSLGCPFSCKFCAIHATFGEKKIRYWSPEWVLKQIDILVKVYKVKNIKIIDEMFIFNPDHFLPICNGLIKRDYDLNLWAYTRVDTVQKRYLKKLKKAGFNWLGIGIESGSKKVRDGVSKGRFVRDDIVRAVYRIKEAGIYVNGAFVFGLPDDDLKSMQKTLDLAMDLNCEWANFYCATAYPGSELYNEAVSKGTKLPDSWIGYSQHSYETHPLPTKKLSAKQVLCFRDDAFCLYYTNPKYLNLVEDKFGIDARHHIEDMTKIKLKRKLLTQKP